MQTSGGTAGTATGGASQLQTLVYTSPTHEFEGARGTFSPTTSTLIAGQREAVLIDAQYMESDVAALGDMIEGTGKELTAIYITHGHADHHFGLGPLLERFPRARALAIPGGGTIDTMRGMIDEAKRDADARRVLLDPYALSPDRSAEPDLGPERDPTTVVRNASLGGFLAPFVMGTVNSRVNRP